MARARGERERPPPTPASPATRPPNTHTRPASHPARNSSHTHGRPTGRPHPGRAGGRAAPAAGGEGAGGEACRGGSAMRAWAGRRGPKAPPFCAPNLGSSTHGRVIQGEGACVRPGGGRVCAYGRARLTWTARRAGADGDAKRMNTLARAQPRLILARPTPPAAPPLLTLHSLCPHTHAGLCPGPPRPIRGRLRRPGGPGAGPGRRARRGRGRHRGPAPARAGRGAGRPGAAAGLPP